MNIIEFGFKQHLTCLTYVIVQQKEKALACRVTWKKQTRGVGKHCGLDWFYLFYTWK
jgi:hypothetical protein